MKIKLLIISMLISINVLSQEVKVTLSTDAISGDKSLFTEYWLNFGVDKSRGFLSGNISYMESEYGGFYYLSLMFTGKIGCSLKYGKLLIKLKNGELIEMINTSDIDCGMFKGIYFGSGELGQDVYNMPIEEVVKLQESIFNSLLEDEWELIRLWGSDYYTDIYPNETRKIKNPSAFFQKHIQAIQDKP